MKNILLALAVVSLVACTPSAVETNFVPKDVLPETLKDCSFYELRNKEGSVMRVVRCPNQSKAPSSESKIPILANPASPQATGYTCMNGILNKRFNSPENHSVTYTQLFDGNQLPIACKS